MECTGFSCTVVHNLEKQGIREPSDGEFSNDTANTKWTMSHPCTWEGDHAAGQNLIQCQVDKKAQTV